MAKHFNSFMVHRRETKAKWLKRIDTTFKVVQEYVEKFYKGKVPEQVKSMLKRLFKKNLQIKRMINDIIDRRKFVKLASREKFKEFDSKLDHKVENIDKRLY